MGRSPQPARARQSGSRIVIGLMSGTSGDGVDAAAIEIVGRGLRMKVKLLEHVHRAFPPRLRKRVLAAMAPAITTTQELAGLHAALGEFFASVALQTISGLQPRRAGLIGLAGQTVCHLPGSGGPGGTVTLQLGDASRVAARTGLPVVADFRQGDVAAGGQGAPLVPWTDWVLFRDRRISRAVQNIGGIGNVSWLPAGGNPTDVVAFDTGPGNMLIDLLVSKVTQERQSFDRDGRRAARGRVLEAVLDRWMTHPFLARRPPRTTGREVFGGSFLKAAWPQLTRASHNPDDWIATATAFTGRCIADAYKRFLGLGRGRAGGMPVEVILCGGGARNRTLVAMIRRELPDCVLSVIDAHGVPCEAKEAVSFAMLAAARMDGVPGVLPQVTGAAYPALLGGVFEPAAGAAS